MQANKEPNGIRLGSAGGGGVDGVRGGGGEGRVEGNLTNCRFMILPAPPIYPFNTHPTGSPYELLK